MRETALIRGIVQGVGFRPFVHNLASGLGLGGRVSNEGRGVVLEVEGPAGDVEAFFRDLIDLKPPLAHIIRVERRQMDPLGESGFTIAPSTSGNEGTALLPPDTALCDDCAAEMADPADRRHRYPFINCTNCGPRYTIIHGVPYDRPATTMSGFAMCPDCLAEYHDPADRRFHAQPNACPVCGPQVRLTDARGREPGSADPVRDAARALAKGKILAVKGLGGFHLAVDAAHGEAVARLRLRKGREAKPLAIMVPDLAGAERLVELTRSDRSLLTSLQRPIVLAAKRPDHGLAAQVAPGGKYIGVMIAYTPLHLLLLADFKNLTGRSALVMTSGNISEEPMAVDLEQVTSGLGGVVDLILTHNRPIRARADDSVAISALGLPRLIRRARGYLPRPVFLDGLEPHGPDVLAVGPELKNTVCLTRGDEAFLSGHIGDLENMATLAAFEETIDHLQKLLSIRPRALAADLHPDYLSSRWAREQAAQEPGLPLIRVQHHLAHILAALADTGLAATHLAGPDAQPVVGLAMDGTGYGPDRTVWGGEVLIVSATGWRRFGRLIRFRLPGSAQAVRQPWRTGLGLLHLALGPEWAASDLEPVRRAGDQTTLIGQMLDQGLNSPLTSSLGRLFDGLAALSGLRQRAAYEGQAAIELEAALDPMEKGAYPFPVNPCQNGVELDHRPLVKQAATDALSGRAPGVISARFHRALARSLTGAARLAAREAGTLTVVLSGGCFMNTRLLADVHRGLEGAGLTPVIHRDVPTNDGGLALGQVLAARLALAAGRPEMWARPEADVTADQPDSTGQGE